MLSVTEAKAVIARHALALPARECPLLEALGGVLAADAVAPCAIPAFAQSSMDGYAFAFDAATGPMPLDGEMAAGPNTSYRLKPGHAARIFTGAPLPEGADTVVMQERVSLRDGILVLNEKPGLGDHVRRVGAEIKAGEVALPAGARLTPAAIGFLAAIGLAAVRVTPRPRVSVIVTGDELLAPGERLVFGQVYEANSFSLRAALAQAWLFDVRVMSVPDDRERLQQALAAAIETSDLVLLTGGVSVGDYDFVPAAAEACGVTMHFHKVRQRPGKPLYFGRREQTLVFGLPGNPASVLTCFYHYVLPALQAMSGRDAGQRVTAALGTAYRKPAGLTVFLKGRYADGIAMPLDGQESFRLRSFAEANCLIELSETATDIAAGTDMPILMLS